ncbi:Homocysteine S-methyltransferase 1, partial [Cladochytrium tenue]
MLPMLLPFAPPPPPALRLSVAASGLSEFCPLSPAVDPLSGLLSPCLFDSARAVTTLVAAVVLFALSVTAATTAAGHSSPAVTAGRSILQRLGWRRDGGPGGSADDSNEATEPLLAGLGVAEAAGSPPAQRSSGYSAMAVFLRLDLAVAAIAAVTSALCLVLDTIQVATQPDARPSPLPQRHRVPARIVDDSAMALAWALIAVSIALPAMHRRTSLASNRALVATWAMAAAFAAVDLRQWNIALAGLPGGGGEGRPHDPSDAIFATASLLSSACVAAGGVATLLFGPTFGAALSSPDAPTPSTARDLETGAAVDQPTAAGAADAVPTEKPVSAWTNALRNLRRLLPFLRPHGLRYQLFLAATFLVLALGRVVNVVMPIQYKHVVDALGSVPEENRSPYYAWGAVLLFSFLRYLQGGGSGVLGTMQTLLWTPVMLANTRKISVDMLTHLHCLSLQFHINRKTGEVLRVMDRGTNSIGSLLSSLLLQLGPMVLDIVLAIASFTVLFDGLTAM